MNKTKIEYVDYTWNPVVGCKRGCSYCYARKINNRFHYTKDFSELEWRGKAYDKPMPKKPCRIFVGSMSDICYWKPDWVHSVIVLATLYPKYTFMFLTKDVAVYSEYEFPDNCWLGVTYDGKYNKRDDGFNELICSNRLFVSFEPLLGWMDVDDLPATVDWLIIGGLTPKPRHETDWVWDMIKKARVRDMRVFLKDNLKFPDEIKEFPKQEER